MFPGPIKAVLGRGVRSHVERNDLPFTPLMTNGITNGAQTLCPSRNKANLGSTLGEQSGGRLSDARRGPHDQGDLPRQPFRLRVRRSAASTHPETPTPSSS